MTNQWPLQYCWNKIIAFWATSTNTWGLLHKILIMLYNSLISSFFMSHKKGWIQWDNLLLLHCISKTMAFISFKRTFFVKLMYVLFLQMKTNHAGLIPSKRDSLISCWLCEANCKSTSSSSRSSTSLRLLRFLNARNTNQ